jgi:hypothetical protein
MPEMLFVGGPKDGVRLNVSDPPQRMFQFLPAAEFGDRLPSGSYQYVTYRLTGFAGHSRRFELYAFDGLDGDALVQRLLDGYRRQA